MDAEEMMDKDEEEAEEMMDKDEEEMDESEDAEEEDSVEESEDAEEEEKMDEMEDKDEEDKDELEFLKTLPEKWWMQHDTVCSVAFTLNRYSRFANKEQVISFFEKPQYYQKDIDELIKELGE